MRLRAAMAGALPGGCQPIVSVLKTTAGHGDCGPGYYYGDGQVAAHRPGAGIYAYGYPVGSPIQYQSS